MAVRFEKRIASNRLGEFGNLRDTLAYFTVHENGNSSSSPYDEAAFVRNGGGSQRVMYHFAVGVEGGVPTIVQIFPVNKRGIHAGNATGNATSIAVETCMAPPGATSAQTQAALEELMYMLYTHDARIEGMDAGYRFSPDRTVRHGDWPGANPNCPQTMNAQWGGIQRPISNVRKRLDGAAPDPSAEVEPGAIVATRVVLNVRAEPTTGSAIVHTLASGYQALITGESAEGDGYTWWPVRHTAADGDIEGWAAEGDGWLVVVKEAPKPEEPEEPEYVDADPIPELADRPGFVLLANGARLVRLGQQATVTAKTSQLRWAGAGSGSIDADLEVGSMVAVDYLVINTDGSLYGYLDNHARVLFAHLSLDGVKAA